MHRIGFSFVLLASIIGVVAPRTALADSETPKDLHWGEPVAGLQMAVVADLPAGVVHCWICNAESQVITYNPHWLGYWEEIWIEVHDPTGTWMPLSRDPVRSKMRAYDGVGPRKSELAQLAPNQIIATKFPLNTGYLRLTNFPAPAKLGATYLESLGDFQWPERVLQQTSIEVRMVQELAGPGIMQQQQGPNIDPSMPVAIIHSPSFLLDGATMRSFLEKYHQREYEEKKGTDIFLHL